VSAAGLLGGQSILESLPGLPTDGEGQGAVLEEVSLERVLPTVDLGPDQLGGRVIGKGQLGCPLAAEIVASLEKSCREGGMLTSENLFPDLHGALVQLDRPLQVAEATQIVGMIAKGTGHVGVGLVMVTCEHR
jgi:hypothetical protein